MSAPADDRRQRAQDAALTKVLVDGLDDLDWAKIFGNLEDDAEQDAS